MINNFKMFQSMFKFNKNKTARQSTLKIFKTRKYYKKIKINMKLYKAKALQIKKIFKIKSNN